MVVRQEHRSPRSPAGPRARTGAASDPATAPTSCLHACPSCARSSGKPRGAPGSHGAGACERPPTWLPGQRPFTWAAGVGFEPTATSLPRRFSRSRAGHGLSTQPPRPEPAAHEDADADGQCDQQSRSPAVQGHVAALGCRWPQKGDRSESRGCHGKADCHFSPPHRLCRSSRHGVVVHRASRCCTAARYSNHRDRRQPPAAPHDRRTRRADLSDRRAHTSGRRSSEAGGSVKQPSSTSSARCTKCGAPGSDQSFALHRASTTTLKTFANNDRYAASI